MLFGKFIINIHLISINVLVFSENIKKPRRLYDLVVIFWSSEGSSNPNKSTRCDCCCHFIFDRIFAVTTTVKLFTISTRLRRSLYLLTGCINSDFCCGKQWVVTWNFISFPPVKLLFKILTLFFFKTERIQTSGSDLFRSSVVFHVVDM